MIELFQFAAGSWWHLFVTIALICAPGVPLLALRGIVRTFTFRGPG